MHDCIANRSENILYEIVHLHVIIPGSMNIGISQERSSNKPNTKLLITAPVLPKHIIIDTAAAATCVGNMLTAIPANMKFDVVNISVEIHATMRTFSEEFTKYKLKLAAPAINNVITRKRT